MIKQPDSNCLPLSLLLLLLLLLFLLLQQYCHSTPYDGIYGTCSDKPFVGRSITGGFIYRGKQ
jgi:hypothetical protein